MEKYLIIHNPRCSKSRETLKLLASHNIQPDIIDYLNGDLTHALLEKIIAALGVAPRELLRTKEEEFQKLELNMDDSNQIFTSILQHPKILERPIVIKGKQGVICRPPEKVLNLIAKV
jgi:arsenate reductase